MVFSIGSWTGLENSVNLVDKTLSALSEVLSGYQVLLAIESGLG
jgi:hypothetical protein